MPYNAILRPCDSLQMFDLQALFLYVCECFLEVVEGCCILMISVGDSHPIGYLYM